MAGDIDECLGIAGVSIVHDVSIGSPDFEIGRSRKSCLCIGDDFAHLVLLGAIGNIVATITTRTYFKEPLSIETETVSGAALTVVIRGAPNTGDGRQTSQVPTPTQQSVPVLAVVINRELRGCSAQTFR